MSDNMLREKIAEVIRPYAEPGSNPDTQALEIADEILALPEIAEALGAVAYRDCIERLASPPA